MAAARLSAREAAAAARELERRRVLERERNLRFRARQREAKQAPADRSTGRSGRTAAPPGPPIHQTEPLPLDDDQAQAFAREVPPADYEAEPVEVADPEGPRKFAALVSLIFRMAAEDAIERYDLPGFAAGLGATVTASEIPSALQQACQYVYSRAERCAAKHGLGVALPYEDELVTLAAGGGGLVYLMMKFSGRLDRQRPRPLAPQVGGANGGRRAAPPPQEEADVDDDYSPVRVAGAAS